MHNTYLKKNRLSDVLALIQVLALDERSHRSESGLTKELQGKPKSANSWEEIASEHPEFFRVNPEGDHSISLVGRHVLPKTGGKRELPIEFTHKLLETAIQLHDKQVKRSEKWSVWIPIIAVIISGAISIIVAFAKPNEKVSHDNGNTKLERTEKAKTSINKN